jgi:hypothetical protein
MDRHGHTSVQILAVDILRRRSGVSIVKTHAVAQPSILFSAFLVLSRAPAAEQYRDNAFLYVSLTRARNGTLVRCCGA